MYFFICFVFCEHIGDSLIHVLWFFYIEFENEKPITRKRQNFTLTKCLSVLLDRQCLAGLGESQNHKRLLNIFKNLSSYIITFMISLNCVCRLHLLLIQDNFRVALKGFSMQQYARDKRTGTFTPSGFPVKLNEKTIFSVRTNIHCSIISSSSCQKCFGFIIKTSLLIRDNGEKIF